ncbi:MAG: hypothetical protein MUE85_05230 [Microscillaceae bacterium]|jgi:hypothetical protein|nr:hypothetical protein [Microscillaceae bacterium]
MKTYFADIIPKIQRFSEKLDNLTLLTNQHWVVIDGIEKNKTVYIFRNNNELLISVNGKVEKGQWEYLGNKSLLIDNQEGSYLFKYDFNDQNIIALKIDSKEEYAFLVNENRYEGEINSLEKVIDFLTKTYLNPQTKKQIENVEGIVIEEKLRLIEVKSAEETERERKDKLYRYDDTENRTAIILALILILFLILLLFSGS